MSFAFPSTSSSFDFGGANRAEVSAPSYASKFSVSFGVADTKVSELEKKADSPKSTPKQEAPKEEKEDGVSSTSELNLRDINEAFEEKSDSFEDEDDAEKDENAPEEDVGDVVEQTDAPETTEDALSAFAAVAQAKAEMLEQQDEGDSGDDTEEYSSGFDEDDELNKSGKAEGEDRLNQAVDATADSDQDGEEKPPSKGDVLTNLKLLNDDAEDDIDDGVDDETLEDFFRKKQRENAAKTSPALARARQTGKITFSDDEDEPSFEIQGSSEANEEDEFEEGEIEDAEIADDRDGSDTEEYDEFDSDQGEQPPSRPTTDNAEPKTSDSFKFVSSSFSFTPEKDTSKQNEASSFAFDGGNSFSFTPEKNPSQGASKPSTSSASSSSSASGSFNFGGATSGSFGFGAFGAAPSSASSSGFGGFGGFGAASSSTSSGGGFNFGAFGSSSSSGGGSTEFGSVPAGFKLDQ